MLDTLVTFVFYIISSVYSLLLAPFINLFFSLFPNLSTHFENIRNFLVYITTYLSSALHLLLVPREAIILFFDFIAIKYTIYLIQLTVKLGVKVYNTFKP